MTHRLYFPPVAEDPSHGDDEDDAATASTRETSAKLDAEAEASHAGKKQKHEK